MSECLTIVPTASLRSSSQANLQLHATASQSTPSRGPSLQTSFGALEDAMEDNDDDGMSFFFCPFPFVPIV